MMPTMRTFLYTFVVYASFTNAASLGVRSWQEDSVGAVDNTVDQNQERTTFSRLLSAVSPRALQQLVHEYVPNPFKDGDHDALEDVVYVRSPILATSIVQLAVRQAAGNDTSTSDTPTSSSSEVPPPTTSTSEAPSTTPTQEPTTSTEEPTTSSTETPPPTETSETPSNTPTPSSSATPTPTPAPTTEPSSTSETPTKTPDPTSSSSTPVSESTSSHVESSSKGTTSAASHPTTAKPTSTTSFFTSTLPGGAVTVVTEVAVITPGVSEGDDNGTPTSGGMGSLQTDSAAPNLRGPGFELIAGLLLGGVMLA